MKSQNQSGGHLLDSAEHWTLWPASPMPRASPLCVFSCCNCPLRIPSSPLSSCHKLESKPEWEYLIGQILVTCLKESLDDRLLAFSASEVGGGLGPQSRFTTGEIPQTQGGVPLLGPTHFLHSLSTLGCDSPATSLSGPLFYPPSLTPSLAPGRHPKMNE